MAFLSSQDTGTPSLAAFRASAAAKAGVTRIVSLLVFRSMTKPYPETSDNARHFS